MTIARLREYVEETMVLYNQNEQSTCATCVRISSR
jgi:hypothetical protein